VWHKTSQTVLWLVVLAALSGWLPLPKGAGDGQGRVPQEEPAAVLTKEAEAGQDDTPPGAPDPGSLADPSEATEVASLHVPHESNDPRSEPEELLRQRVARKVVECQPGDAIADGGRLTNHWLRMADGTCMDTALASFFRSLADLEAGRRADHVRVLHFGDSAIAADDISRTVRALMQERFGDGGIGFVLPAPAWTWYQHAGITLVHGGSWRKHHFQHRELKDARYGLGGVAYLSAKGGTKSALRIRDEARHPRQRLELLYLRQPGGGDLLLTINDREPVRIETAAPVWDDGFYRTAIEEGIKEVGVRVASARPTRIFGLVFENDRPGVVWDCLGVVGTRATHLRNHNEAHFQSQVGHRLPALIVIHYGLNEAHLSGTLGAAFERRQRQIIQWVRSAAPDASCLVVGPYDLGQRTAGGLSSLPSVPRLIALQRKVALEEGCAFWDPWSATGGSGTAARWLRQRPKLLSGDLTHLTIKGSEHVGQLLYDALAGAYDAWKAGEEHVGER